MKTYHLSPLFFEGLKCRLFVFSIPLMVIFPATAIAVRVVLFATEP
jgi:hypothetical protein